MPCTTVGTSNAMPNTTSNPIGNIELAYGAICRATGWGVGA
jgi:hypothetical protein